jgi:uncharacterized protein (DUF1697 family)
MPRYVALLRGINVGGKNKVAMADLREVVQVLGHTDVATYIQSGNVVFASPEKDAGALADALEREIAARLPVKPAVVVISQAELAQVLADNPFPGEENPKYVHAVFRRAAPGPDAVAAITEAHQRAVKKGSRDEFAVTGRTLYLHTPDGMGRSEFAAQLARPAGRIGQGTARNWATVMKLMAMLDAAGD